MIYNSICVITFPRPKAGIVPLENFLGVMSHFSDQLFVITGNEGYRSCSELKDISVFSTNYNTSSFFLLNVVNYFLLQFKISCQLFKLRKKIDICLFFMGEGLLLPVCVAKILKKPVILILTSSLPKIVDSKKGNIFHKVTKYFEILNYSLSDHIVIYSKTFIKEWGLDQHSHKVSISHEHFLDFSLFNKKTDLNQRDIFVGYIGRLSEEKGIVNFVHSIPSLLKEKPNLKFLIGGTGPLDESIHNYILSNNLEHRVEFTGWIAHNELPSYLNRLKLIVIPSYTEGLPNIMLEAMACNTPVLATSVGAISDVIIDGKTGFIMDNNSSECISTNILRALEFSDLDSVVSNAKTFVEREYTYKKTIERYQQILVSCV